MTKLAVPPPPSPAEESDPFRYGWRHEERPLVDGYTTTVLVPLTLEDVLHPQEGDQVTQSTDHQRRCRYLCDVLEARLAHDPSAVVLHDVRVKWDVPELLPHGPDLMVIFGVRERKNWSTFDVAEEATRPGLIIEVTSPATRQVDLYDKLDEYDMAGVPLYVIVDAVQRRGQTVLRLLGYQQSVGAYQPITSDERGWLWLESVRLWLGIRDSEVYCFDEHGTQIGGYAEVAAALAAETQAHAEVAAALDAEAQARVAAETRAEVAETRAESAEARIRELEAEMRRLRGEA